MRSNSATVLLRGIFRDAITYAFSHRLLHRDDRGVILYLPPGTRGKTTGRDANGRYLDRWGNGVLIDHVWQGQGVLRLTPFSRSHSVELHWDQDERTFAGWYVNLQEPLVEDALGFRTRDNVLDVWIDPDGRWSWKDEDELEEAVGRGYFTLEEAHEIRTEGERVLADWPFPTGWEDWRPDPAWPIPELPEGWDHV